MSSPLVAEVVDPTGRRVRLDQEAVTHIVESHPEMAPHIGELVAAISSPDAIEPDPWRGRCRYLLRRAGPSAWLRVVVDFGYEPARVVTAFGVRKAPLGGD